MERTLITLTGSTQATLIDQDIAHIGRVMRPSLLGDLGGPILPAAYWRKRLHQLLDTGQLSHAQLCGVDTCCCNSINSRPAPSRRWTSCRRQRPCRSGQYTQ